MSRARECKGSGRSGFMPGAGRRSAKEWAEYRAGRLWCPRCCAYVAHDERGRLVTHNSRRAG